MTAPRRGRPRSSGVRERVIEALISLIAERGYGGTSMDDVAERAGVAKATIYRRWTSKEALILEAHRSMLDTDDVPDTGSLAGDLGALVERIGRLFDDERMPRLMQATMGEMMTNPELATVFRTTLLLPRLAMVERVFRNAEARGEVARGVDWRPYASALIGSNIFRVTMMGERPDHEANARLVAMIARDAASQAEDPAVGR